MNLKPQPRPPRRAARGTRVASASRRRGKPGGSQARRPGVPTRQRLAGRLPSIRRVVTFIAAVAATAGFVALLSGPWLQVTNVTWAGQQFTAEHDLERILDRQEGNNLLTLATRPLQDRLERLPAVASASVMTTLPGELRVELVERQAAFVWETESVSLLGSADGTLFAALPPDQAAQSDLDHLPHLDDRRASARLMTTGDRIPESLVASVLRLAALDPAALGSTATRLEVRLDDEYGLGLASIAPAWEMALGAYGMDPGESTADATARLERQVTAVRTLFASRPESGIGWVDVRNPGKVYFRAKG